MTMLSVAEAQARLLALVPLLPVEQAPLIDAVGRHAAADVIARRSQPAADFSAMDGYAIRFGELPGPWTVVGESKAGTALDRALAPGEAARIFTGAPVPQGADTVLVQEEAARDGARLTLSGEGPSRRGLHIRAAGSDFASGALLVRSGDLISPARMALAVMGGHASLPVRRRPRVRLLSTGDELVAPGAPTSAVALPASNGPMLQAMLLSSAAIAEDRGVIPDRLDALTEGFAAATHGADILVTTGGASVGDHDLVRPALAAAGATLDFWRVAMRPGKPLMAGRLGDTIILGLPGNPVSAFVTARLFLLPLVAHLAGDPDPLPKAVRRRLTAPLPAVGARDDYVRAMQDGDGVRPLRDQDSAALSALARADLLIVRPAHSDPAAVDEFVDTLRIA